jgi:hypothetical protein
MRIKTSLLAGLIISIFLAACGGDNTNPYDGTWALVYPALSKQSSVSSTQSTICSNPPATIIIQNNSGTGTVTASCTTTVAATSGVKSTSYTQATYANIAVTITAKPDVTSKDIFNATANGVPFTGQCLSTVSCSGTSTAGDTVTITR